MTESRATRALRGATTVELMLTAAEWPAPDSLPRCIRVLLHVETARPRAAMRRVYLRGARALRPDLVDGAPDDPSAERH